MKRLAAFVLAALLALAPSVAVAQNYGSLGNNIAVTSQTATSAANTAVTVTLAAPAAGLFHYIVAVRIFHSCTAAVVGTALLSITSTNLPFTWSDGNACAVGSDNVPINFSFSVPVKSTAAATQSTIVCPAHGAAAICEINVIYFIGP
jgi:uncharacterized membrane protein